MCQEMPAKGAKKKLTNQAVPVYVKSAQNGEVEKMLYRDPGNENKVILTLEKKVFDLDQHEETFARSEKWLQEFDKEPKVFGEDLFEFDISFPPSYPFKEDTCSGSSYMRTRCPSWCDRILLSKSALSIVNTTPLDSAYLPIVYQLVGENVSMGDHKPVMLMFNLRQHTEGDHLRKSSQQSLFENISHCAVSSFHPFFTGKITHEESCVPSTATGKKHLNLPRISVTFPASKNTTSFSRFIHVKHPGSPARIFRETTV
ncbi:inositol polyphosphate-5-phosphatase A-like [Stegodyphus dumicola]|uniref:inositol polyphosphate-5-phosphatase A-like n=1 Tax=Stegodyphus dumicola TaxID=202533 RepID=UPI0015A75D90|nr:inositol polyphosphate-5-phosphatase A-like [Stegodyphus dumicola]